MPVGSLLRLLAAGLFVAALPGLSAAQVLYTENFDDGTAASRWTVSSTTGSASANASNFAFDYSTVGIPTAPNGTGSTGLRFDVNTGPTGARSAIMAFPNGQNFTPSYTLAFDVWFNVVGATATTEYGIFGGGHTSTAIQAPTEPPPGVGPSSSGIDFALTGDEGSGRDVRVYVNGLERTGSSGPTAGGYARATSASFPQDEYQAPYFFSYNTDAPENQWVEMAVTITATQSTWTVNGNTWARTTATTGTGNIMLGYMDLFTSVAASDIFSVYDNVRVTAPVAAPTEQRWSVDGVTAGGSGTWVNMGRSWLVDSGSARWNWALPTIFEGTAGTVTIDGAVTAGGGLRFRTDGYTITSGTLFLGATSATDARRDLQIFDPNAVATVDVPTGMTATIASVVRGRQGLTKLGDGTLLLTNANLVSGTTVVQQGTLELGNQSALASSPVSVVPGGTLRIDPNLGMISTRLLLNGGTVAAAGATLTVDRDIGVRQFIVNSGKLAGSPGLEVTLGGTMIMSGSAVTSVDVATLVVDESATGGRVDLGVGRINVAAGGITAEALVLDILAGRTGTAGLWSGTTGITSSVAAAAVAAASSPRAVGWIDDGAGGLSVAFSAPGDSNIDGFVDILDVANFLSAGKYDSGAPAVWSQGDFNYDGIVDILDVGDFVVTGLFNAGTYLPVPSASVVVTAVPEPATGVAAGLACLIAAIQARRRVRSAADRHGPS